MGPALPDLGAEGSKRQDIGDLIQGGGSGIATVWIIDVVHYKTHRQDVGAFTIGWTAI